MKIPTCPLLFNLKIQSIHDQKKIMIITGDDDFKKQVATHVIIF